MTEMSKASRTSGRPRPIPSVDSASAAEAGLGVVKRQVPHSPPIGLELKARTQSALDEENRERGYRSFRLVRVAEVGSHASWRLPAMVGV